VLYFEKLPRMLEQNLKTELTIVLASRDRPQFVYLAIDALLNQSNMDFKFIVSENSQTNYLYEELLTHYGNKIRIIRRNNDTATEHFVKIIQECTTEYLGIVHDDDILNPKFIEKMLIATTNYQNAVSFATNGEIINKLGVVTRGYIFKSSDDCIFFNDERRLAEMYLNVYSKGVAPFPSYIFKSRVAKNLLENLDISSKFWDAIFISRLARYGSVIWINQNLISYRVHSGNDGKAFKSKDYKYLIKNFGFEPVDYRVYMFYHAYGLSCIPNNTLTLKVLIILLKIYIIKFWNKFYD
jgi:hypothetical protein